MSKRQVLNLKCERCGHDTVCAEHSLAALPGTLVIHIKRFKAVVRPSTPPSSVPTTAVTDLTGMENDSSAATATAASAGAENRESKGASDDGVGVSNGKAEASSWLAGVSYEKTMERVLVPLQLDLTRFCTEFTGNAPSEDLGQVRACCSCVVRAVCCARDFVLLYVFFSRVACASLAWCSFTAAVRQVVTVRKSHLGVYCTSKCSCLRVLVLVCARACVCSRACGDVFLFSFLLVYVFA